jgi:hypothetical protein
LVHRWYSKKKKKDLWDEKARKALQEVDDKAGL